MADSDRPEGWLGASVAVGEVLAEFARKANGGPAQLHAEELALAALRGAGRAPSWVPDADAKWEQTLAEALHEIAGLLGVEPGPSRVVRAVRELVDKQS